MTKKITHLPQPEFGELPPSKQRSGRAKGSVMDEPLLKIALAAGQWARVAVSHNAGSAISYTSAGKRLVQRGAVDGKFVVATRKRDDGLVDIWVKFEPTT